MNILFGKNIQLGKISNITDLKVEEDEINRIRKTKHSGLTICELLSGNKKYKDRES